MYGHSGGVGSRFGALRYRCSERGSPDTATYNQYSGGVHTVNATVLSAINEQINSEFEASYTYLAMAGFCERQKFVGAATWLRLQSEEERLHGLKLFDFVLARDGAVELKAIDQPNTAFAGLQAVFEQALIHEQRVTVQINALYELCFKEKGFAEMAQL